MIKINEDKKRFIKNNKLISKTQKRFRNEKSNVFTKEINKITLSSSNDKIIELIDSIETYAYGMNLVCKKNK